MFILRLLGNILNLIACLVIGSIVLVFALFILAISKIRDFIEDA